jgi:hypothetical protein
LISSALGHLHTSGSESSRALAASIAQVDEALVVKDLAHCQQNLCLNMIGVTKKKKKEKVKKSKCETCSVCV